MLNDIITSFVLGLLTPLTAVCVLPLYPGFLSYLANNAKKSISLFGVLVSAGILTFMLALGLIFTTLVEISLTRIIGIVSPIAFGILLIISIFLMLDKSIPLPKKNIPIMKNPYLNAFLFGLFFGAIVIPCNPLFLAALFARSLIMSNFISNMVNFVSFGIGLSFPLLVFSLISIPLSNKIIEKVTKHKKIINLVSGIIMFIISLYYLLNVFGVLGAFI